MSLKMSLVGDSLKSLLSLDVSPCVYVFIYIFFFRYWYFLTHLVLNLFGQIYIHRKDYICYLNASN